jgi:hypothetical protein
MQISPDRESRENRQSNVDPPFAYVIIASLQTMAFTHSDEFETD